MKLYDENGYLNMQGIFENEYPFNIIIGGRGIGKTYGALKYVKEHNIPFMFTRRTQQQIDLLKQPAFNPYGALNNDMHWNIEVRTIGGKNFGFYEAERNIDSGEYEISGPPIGVAAALSTFSNMRGFDASWIKCWLFDEFIKEPHEKPIKEEGMAVLNMYESINRNRELKGEQPVKFIAMANSEYVANPLLLELQLATRAATMQRKGAEQYFDKERGIALFLPKQSPISLKKAETALYKLSKHTTFNKMALGNEFNEIDWTLVRPASLINYIPLARVGELTIYKHKSDELYYITEHFSGQCPSYTSGETDLKRFRQKYFWIWQKFLYNKVYFEEYIDQVVFEKYFGM